MGPCWFGKVLCWYGTSTPVTKKTYYQHMKKNEKLAVNNAEQLMCEAAAERLTQFIGLQGGGEQCA